MPQERDRAESVIRRQARSLGLTPRELDIMLAMLDGHTTNEEIATQLGITSQTVKNTLARVMLRTQTTNRLQLMLRLIDIW